MSPNDATFLSLFGNPDKLDELNNALRQQDGGLFYGIPRGVTLPETRL